MFEFKDIGPNPKFTLESFAVVSPKDSKPSAASRPSQKLPSVPSASNLSDSKILGSVKAKEKISIPAVNTKGLEINEKAAIS